VTTAPSAPSAMAADAASASASASSSSSSTLGRWALRLGLLTLLVGSAVLAFRKLSPEAALWPRLADASPRDVVVALVALVVVNVANGLVLRGLVRRLGVHLPVRSWLGITFVAGLTNLVSPVASAGAVRAAYLKRAHDVSLTSFASVFASTMAFGLAVTGAVGAAALVALDLPGGHAGRVALAVSLALVFGLIGALVVGPHLQLDTERGGVRGRIARVLAGWNTLGADRGLLVRLALTHGAGALAYGIAAVAAFRIAGFSGPWLVAFGAAAFARLGSIVAFTPAGLGITEAVGVVSAQVLGADGATALLAMVVLRVLSTVVTLVGGALGSWSLLKDAR
jgi:uncharacterized membrane protein YbhN (UPF0104 family)